MSPVICFAQKKHTHKPNLSDSAKRAGSGQYDPKLFIDSSKIHSKTKLSNNVVTYVMKNYLCVKGEWYQVRQNVDTFSTKRKAKYSNMKYKNN